MDMHRRNNIYIFGFMIITIFIYILSSIMGIIEKILPRYQIWPDVVLNGLNYFATTLSDFNILFPIDTLFQCMIFIGDFLSAYLIVRLILIVINFFRGTGELKI